LSCREHSISPILLDRWRAQYDFKGQDALHEPCPVDLERRAKELEACPGRSHLENEFLHEALGKQRCLPASFIAMRPRLRFFQLLLLDLRIGSMAVEKPPVHRVPMCGHNHAFIDSDSFHVDNIFDIRCFRGIGDFLYI